MSELGSLFRTKRFAVEAVLAFVFAFALFALGFWVASLILASLPQVEGLTWIVNDPNDAFFAKMKLGAVTALAPLVALVAGALHRAGARAHPGWRATLIYVAVPIVIVALGVAVQVNGVHALARVDQDMWGMPLSVQVADLLPGYMTTNMLIIGALVLWVATFAAARARHGAEVD